MTQQIRELMTSNSTLSVAGSRTALLPLYKPLSKIVSGAI
jgi:hypothetical protein